ncbi:hypothetical protein ACLOJK_013843 [Asimina triloba]
MGKKRNPFSFPKKFLPPKKTEMQPIDPASSSAIAAAPGAGAVLAGGSAKSNKKKTGARLWMRFDRTGQSELLECDKNAITKRVSIPARDLRILGPVFSHSSNILGIRERKVGNYRQSGNCMLFRLWTNIRKASVKERMTLAKEQPNQKKIALSGDDLNLVWLLNNKMGTHSRTQELGLHAREKAMVVNLEFIKAIVTAEEVLLLDPLCHEVLPFVDQLRQQLPLKSPFTLHDSAAPTEMQEKERYSTDGQWLPAPDTTEGLQSELPFEFQVLEIALEVVCSYLDTSVAELETNAYPVLDELARNVSTKNLERVLSLKSNLTRLLARVQKVRDEIEHLLDDNEDMAHLYLTRKQIQYQQFEALAAAGASSSAITLAPNLQRAATYIQSNASMIANLHSDDNDVEDLEMLLEAYFMQLDGTRNKILSVREYIDDTEDYVNIQLDNQRNELIQLQLILTIASFALTFGTMMAGIFGINIPCSLFNMNGIFGTVVGSYLSASFLLFLMILGYARWKKLLGS